MRALSICLAVAMSGLTAGCQAGDDVAALVSHTDRAGAAKTAVQLVEVAVACGASVVADLKLANDLICSGDALIVNADNITIDLNGHTLTGSGIGIGITVRARQNVTIRGGTIRSFVTGIFVANSSGVLIKGNGFTQNREAVFLNGSSDNVVMENHAWQNQLRGIMLRPTLSGVISTRNLIRENILQENRSGILLFGQPGNIFEENWISQSSFAAVDLTGGGASGNVFTENVLETSAAGISFGVGWTGNDFVENRLLQNTCAIAGTTTGNTFTENQIIGNTSDSC